MSSLKFDVNREVATSPISSTLNGVFASDAFTVEYWIKPTQTGPLNPNGGEGNAVHVQYGWYTIGWTFLSPSSSTLTTPAATGRRRSSPGT